MLYNEVNKWNSVFVSRSVEMGRN